MTQTKDKAEQTPTSITQGEVVAAKTKTATA